MTDDDECRLKRLEAVPGQIEMTLEISHRMRLLLAEFMAETLDQEGGTNYVSLEVVHPTKGTFEMTAQRVAGKRPAVVAAEERERANRAEAEVKRLREALEVLRDVEWCVNVRGYGATCPICAAGRDDGRKHEKDCALAAAIAKGER